MLPSSLLELPGSSLLWAGETRHRTARKALLSVCGATFVAQGLLLRSVAQRPSRFCSLRN